MSHGRGRKKGGPAIRLPQNASWYIVQAIERHPGDALTYTNFGIAVYHLAELARIAGDHDRAQSLFQAGFQKKCYPVSGLNRADF